MSLCVDIYSHSLHFWKGFLPNLTYTVWFFLWWKVLTLKSQNWYSLKDKNNLEVKTVRIMQEIMTTQSSGTKGHQWNGIISIQQPGCFVLLVLLAYIRKFNLFSLLLLTAAKRALHKCFNQSSAVQGAPLFVYIGMFECLILGLFLGPHHTMFEHSHVACGRSAFL